MHWWKELRSCQGPDKWEIWNSVSVHQTVAASAVTWKIVALIAWLKSGLEQRARAVWLQQDAFACRCEQQNVFCKPGKSTDLVNVEEEYVKMHKCISRAWCKPLNMKNLLSGFVMFSGGTLFWYVTYSKLRWIVRWQCYHCHISGNQLFKSIRYVNVCILH